MNVTWIVDSDAFSDYHEALVSEIQSQGHVAQTLPPFFSTCEWGDTSRFYDELAPADRCVVCHASFEFTDLVAQDELWTPGTYGNSSAVDYTSYCSPLSKYLLNQDCELVPFGQLAGKADSLLRTFGVAERVFVRPNSGRKPFIGGLHSQTDIERCLLPSSRMSPDSLVVVSRPKRIAREWRFVVVDGEVVCGSMYKEFDVIRQSSDVEPRAYDFASSVAQAGFEPDRVWVLDTCETHQGAMYALEVNGFSSANWYDCDLAAIVSSVARVALDDWQSRRSTA